MNQGKSARDEKWPGARVEKGKQNFCKITRQIFNKFTRSHVWTWGKTRFGHKGQRGFLGLTSVGGSKSEGGDKSEGADTPAGGL